MALFGVLAAASFGLKVGSAILSHGEQNRRYEQNRRAVLENLKIQREALAARAEQERTRAGQAIERAGQVTDSAESMARVAAAASGVGGASVDALLRTIRRDEAQSRMSIRDNLVVSLDQIQRARESAEAQARGRIAAVQPASGLLTGLRIAGAGIQALTDIQSLNPPLED